MNEFVRRYDAELAKLDRLGTFPTGGYFNVGYWTEGIIDQEQASRALVDELATHLPSGPGTTLDLACSSGATTRHVRRLRPEATVIGADLSLRRLTDHRPGVPRVCMDAARLAFPESSLGAILCVEAAFHFASRLAFLRRAFRALEPGGVLVLSDILFRDTSWVGDWMVPEENRVKSLEAYLESYRQIGWDDLRWVDATDACWLAFCRHRRREAQRAYAAGELDGSEYETRIRSLDGLEHETVDHYLLVVARKAR